MTSGAGRILGIGMVGVLVSAGPAAGQERFEVGMDGLISYTMTERVERMPAVNIQTWAFPAQRFRVGWPRIGRLQPQAAVAFAVADFGAISTVTFSAGLSGLYQITGSGPRSGLFVSVGAGFDLLSDNGTDVQWTGTVGLGARIDLLTVTHDATARSPRPAHVRARMRHALRQSYAHPGRQPERQFRIGSPGAEHAT